LTKFECLLLNMYQQCDASFALPSCTQPPLTAREQMWRAIRFERSARMGAYTHLGAPTRNRSHLVRCELVAALWAPRTVPIIGLLQLDSSSTRRARARWHGVDRSGWLLLSATGCVSSRTRAAATRERAGERTCLSCLSRVALTLSHTTLHRFAHTDCPTPTHTSLA
jgi:hypothetical protein